MANGCFYQANFAQPNFIQPCPVIPPVGPGDLGGAGFVSGTGAFRPHKYYAAFHRFLGIAKKKGHKREQRELVKLERIARKFIAEFKQSEISGTEAARGLVPPTSPATRNDRNTAAIARMLAEAVAKYEKLEAEHKELERIEAQAEEDAIVNMLLMMD